MMSRRYVWMGLGLAIAALPPMAPAAEYFIAPGGSNAGSGAIDSPWATFDFAIGQINGGDTLYVRGGTYDLSSRVRIQKGGSNGSPINMWAYPGETPVLDFASNPSTTDRGIQLERDWWHIKGLTIQNAPDNGMWISGSNNVFEQLVLRWNGDSGLQLSGDSSRHPSNNLILNTDSYENYDPQNNGENADGFAAKFREIGPGNVFSGNRAWGNSDDGWDFWAAAYGITVENSWAFANGYNIWDDPNFAGDGNGIKLGQDSGQHEVYNSLAWGNKNNGFDINGNARNSVGPNIIEHGVTVYNVTAFNNGRNYRFDEDFAHVLRNNLSYDGSVTISSATDDQFNSWNGGVNVTAADFLSLDDSLARGPRQADGSLPVMDFLHLAPNSDLIDAGIDVGRPFNGAAPDLGAFEAPEPVLQGDFNGDGFVDLGDYTVWRDNFGSGDDAVINHAGDEVSGVGSGDYDVWVAGFQQASSANAAAATRAVPEPATLVLGSVLAVGGLAFHRRLLGSGWLALLVAWCLVCLAANHATAQQPAFPGAEGYGGTFTGSAPVGGWFANATVYHVTNLNDDGPGSFRNAFDENSSNRVIVFDVAGTIQLTSGSLDIKNLSNYYIAGQTAPGPVTIYGDTTQVTHSSGKMNSNVVLRYLTFRKGTGDGADAITFAGSGLGTNMIFDHVSASWAEDEILSVANNNTDVTVQYSMINDALVSNHAYGSLIRPRISSQVTFHHNLYANNASRQARFGTYNGETLTADFRNNVVYNFRDRASYTGGSSEAEQETTDVNYVGNYIIAGPGTEGDPNIAYSVDKNVDTSVYQSGNFIDPDDAPGGTPSDGVLDGTDTGWGMFRINNQTDQTLTQMATPFNTPAVTTQTAPDAYTQVVNHVGNWWWDRDTIDTRVVGNVTNFTGVPLAASAPIAGELSGVLNASLVSHAANYDLDNDGMADDWEAAHGGDLVWNQDFDADGYINLIDFINEKGEFPAPAPIVFQGGTNRRYAQITNWRTDDGGVTVGTAWQPSRFDDAVIRSGSVFVDAVGQHAGRLWIAPETGDDATVQVAGGWLWVADAAYVGSAGSTGALDVHAGAELVAPQLNNTTGGTISGRGLITGQVNNDGTLAPGDGDGVLTIAGGVAQSSAGSLAFELTSASEFGSLEVLGDVDLAGTLQVALLGGFEPMVGDSFDLLDWTGAANIAFSTSNLPNLQSGKAWDDSLFATTGVLSVVAAAPELAGDFNDDGVVNLADYTVWRDHLDSNTPLPNDNQLGVPVGQQHYDLWKSSFGNTLTATLGAETTSRLVPEPLSSFIALLAAAPLLAYRMRRAPQR